MPPQHGKSRLTTVEFATWLMGKAPGLKVVCASFAQDLSSRNSKEAKERLQEPFYHQIFPDTKLHPSDKKGTAWRVVTTQPAGKVISEFQAKHQGNTPKARAAGGYKAVGIKSALTGHGADVLIVDDPFKDYQEAHSPGQREAVWNWFLSVAYTRLSPDAIIIIIMTRWHVDDLVGRLEDPQRAQELEDAGVAGEKWHKLNVKAMAEDKDDPLGRKKGEAAFPRKYHTKRLKAIKAMLGSYLWGAMYQGVPVPKGGNYINTDNFIRRKESEMPDYLQWVRFWDLACTEDQKADFTAGIMGALDNQGALWLRALRKGQWAWPVARSTICQIAEEEKVVVGAEANAGFKAVAANLREEMPDNIVLREYVVPGNAGDKLIRALPWIALVENRKVFLVEGEWILDFLVEAQAFPASPHDDQMDAVSGVYVMLKNRKRFMLA